MNCRIFRSKLMDYLDDNMQQDMKDVMKKHLEECATCKAAYEEEKTVDELFISALQHKEIEFNSLRANVINSIDKNRYGKSPLKKMKYGMSRFRWQIVSTAAVFFIAVLISPMVMNLLGGSNKSEQRVAKNTDNVEMKKQDGGAATTDSASQPEMSIASQEVSDKQENARTLAAEDNQQNNTMVAEYLPAFTRTDVKDAIDENNITPWKASPDNSFSAAIDGKYKTGTEEGIGTLLIKNNKDNSIWRLSLSNNDELQYSPLVIEWYDNSNIMVIIGNGYGTISFGGNLYMININTGNASELYSVGDIKDSKEQITSVAKNNDNLVLNVRVFDDNMNNYIDTEKVISLKNINVIMP